MLVFYDKKPLVLKHDIADYKTYTWVHVGGIFIPPGRIQFVAIVITMIERIELLSAKFGCGGVILMDNMLAEKSCLFKRQ